MKFFRSALLIPFLLVLLTFCYTLFYSNFHLDPHHDGIILVPAIDVFNGKHLFSDTFTQYGALTTVIHVSFMQFFGPNLLAIRYSAVFFYTISALFLYAIWSKLLSQRGAALVIVIWLTIAYFPSQAIMVPFLGWSSVYALTFQLAASYLLLKYLGQPRRHYLILLGATVSLAFWSRQPVGVFLLGAVVVFFFLLRLFTREFSKLTGELLYLFAGFTSTCLIFLLWLGRTNSIPEWWEQSFRLAFNFGSRLSNQFSLAPILGNLFPSVLEQKKNWLWNLFPISVLIVFISRLCLFLSNIKVVSIRTHQLLALSLIALASWLQYFPGSDHSHVFWAATPMIGLLLIIIPETIYFLMRHAANDLKIKYPRLRSLSLIISFILLALTLLPFIGTDFKGLKTYLRAPFITLNEPISVKGMRVSPSEASVLSAVKLRLETFFTKYPNDFALNLSPDAFYILIDSHMRQIHRAPMFWDWATDSVWPELYPLIYRITDTDRPVFLMRDPVFGKLADDHYFNNYCSFDLHSKDDIRMQIYMRPLILRVPIEKVVNVVASSNTIVLTPQFNNLLLLSAVSSSGTISDALPLKIAKKTVLTFSKPFDSKGFALTFASDDFGACNYQSVRPLLDY